MRLLLCWGSVAESPLAEIVRAAGRAGFDAVSATPEHHARWRQSGTGDGEIGDILAEAGVTVEVIDPLIRPLPGTPGLGDVDPAYKHFFAHDADQAFAAAIALGAPTVNLAHFLGARTATDALAAAVAGLARRADDHGLRLTLEFLPDSGVPDLTAAREVVARAGAPNVSVMFDSWHFTRSGGTLGDLAGLPAGTFGGIQLSDRREPPAGTGYVIMADRLLPGEGDLDLGETLSLVTAGALPDVPVGVEVFNDTLRSMPVDDAAELVYGRTMQALPQLSGA